MPPEPASTETNAPSAADHATLETAQFGRTLRELRQSRRMTLTVVAQKAKITASFLSQIERGLAVPSLPALYRIARVFDFTPSDLLEQHGEELPIHTRKSDRPRVETQGNFIKERLLPNSVRTMQVFGGMLAEGTVSGEPRAHGDSDELLLVVSGSVTVDVDDRKFHLSTGDTLYYRSSSVHALHNEGSEEAEVLWIVAPPT